MPDVTSFDGVQLSCHVVGEGEPVTVMGHGLTSTYRDFEIFAPFLPGTKVMFDFRGHGDSECPPPGSYTTEDFAQDLNAVAKEYEATCAAGVSLGVAAIMRLLVTEPDRFEKLILLLPGRIPVHPQVKERLLHLGDLLERYSVEEAADITLASPRSATSARSSSRARSRSSGGSDAMKLTDKARSRSPARSSRCSCRKLDVSSGVNRSVSSNARRQSLSRCCGTPRRYRSKSSVMARASSWDSSRT